jgi:methylmalonyl-CoA/ethylmalonyl-CoA epimerase
MKVKKGCTMSNPTESNTRLGNLVQIGIIVRDLDSTIEALSKILGLGPFRFVVWPPDRPNIKSTYYKQTKTFKFREALTQIGPIELELIQPLEGENIYTDFLEEHGEGLHHLRFDVKDPEKFIHDMKQFNIDVIQSGTGTRPGTKWFYLGTEGILKFTVELMGYQQDPNPNTSFRDRYEDC